MICPQARVRLLSTGAIGVVTRLAGELEGRRGWVVALTAGQPMGRVVAAEDELERLSFAEYERLLREMRAGARAA